MSNKSAIPRITSVRFQNYKALRDFRLNLAETNFLVGPNNAGKSTIIGAFRVLAIALRRMGFRKPETVNGPNGRFYGIPIPADSLPISIENVHTDLSEADSSVTFRISNGNELILYFPKDGGCFLLANAQKTRLASAAAFREAFPVALSVIPVLGPVEQGEILVLAETVEKNVASHRSSRNFRSYWFHNPDEFDRFLRKSWPKLAWYGS